MIPAAFYGMLANARSLEFRGITQSELYLFFTYLSCTDKTDEMEETE